jgi:hypothetical protein
MGRRLASEPLGRRSGRAGCIGMFLASLVLVVVPACSDRATQSGPNQVSYALIRDPGWTLHEAIDPHPHDPLTTAERPPLDWWAEYVQMSPSESRMVRLSGHRASFAETRAELEMLGFALEDVTAGRWTGARGTSVDDQVGPQVVVLDAEGWSLLMLSYELELGPLTELAAAVEVVDESTWVSAGGVIR